MNDGVSMLKLFKSDIKQPKFRKISNFLIFKETSQAITLFKMNKFLLVVAEILVQTETQDQLLDSSLVIHVGPVVNT